MTTETLQKPLNFLAMKGVLAKMGSNGSERLIKWEDLSIDFTKNLRDDYGDLDDLNSLVDGMIQPIVGYIDADGKAVPTDGFRRLSWMKRRLETGLSIPEIKFTLDYESQTTLGRLKLILNSATAKQLTLVEQGKGYKQLRDECGKSIAEISEISHKSQAHIGACLLLVDHTSEEVLTCVEEGSISASEVIKLNQKLEPEEVETLVMEAVNLAKEQGKKATAKTIKQVREKKEPKTKVEDVESQFCENGDEYVEHKAIADFLARLSKEDWEELDLGPLRKILAMINT